jgi:hypothetical protein
MNNLIKLNSILEELKLMIIMDCKRNYISEYLPIKKINKYFNSRLKLNQLH